MEIVIGLLVIAVLGYFLFFRTKEEPVVVVEATPYKVETPPTLVEEVAAPVVEAAPVVVAVVEAAPVVVAEAAPAKPPRKPRATKVAATSVKAPAKKAAPKKVAAIKATPKTTKSKKT